jgi:hypothetical protein
MEYEILKCKCGDQHLHLFNVIVYTGSDGDNPTQSVSVTEGKGISLNVVTSNKVPNYVAHLVRELSAGLHYHCEICANEFVEYRCFHKGSIFAGSFSSAIEYEIDNHADVVIAPTTNRGLVL